ncbi:hypothetical protein STEG23_007459 [Scotinomys teguina]
MAKTDIFVRTNDTVAEGTEGSLPGSLSIPDLPPVTALSPSHSLFMPLASPTVYPMSICLEYLCPSFYNKIMSILDVKECLILSIYDD